MANSESLEGSNNKKGVKNGYSHFFIILPAVKKTEHYFSRGADRTSCQPVPLIKVMRLPGCFMAGCEEVNSARRKVTGVFLKAAHSRRFYRKANVLHSIKSLGFPLFLISF